MNISLSLRRESLSIFSELVSSKPLNKLTDHSVYKWFLVQYRKLFGEDISILGFGCMRLPTNTEGKVDEAEAKAQIRHGIDLGINYIDTALPYHGGQSELVLGKALLDGYREKVKLVTKAPIWMYKEKDDYRRNLLIQLEKLQTKYLDVYMMHSLDGTQFQKCVDLGFLKEAEKAKEEGLIKHIGFSFHGSYNDFVHIIDSYNWDVAQIQFNYMDTDNQATEKGLKYAGKKGIPIIVMEPLLGGKLVQENEDNKQITTDAPVQRSLAEWAFKFVWNYPEVKVVLSGMNSMEMVDENCTSANRFTPLTEGEHATIKRLQESFRKWIYVKCTRCEYCLPCPADVNIPLSFRYFNEAKWPGGFNQGKAIYKALLAQTRDELPNKEMGGSGSLCVNCGQCVPKCPQGLDIPGLLEETVKFFS